jgi:hypothetical protein
MTAGASQLGGTGLRDAEAACCSLSPDVRSTGSQWLPVLMLGPGGRPGSPPVAGVGSQDRRLSRRIGLLQQALVLWATHSCPHQLPVVLQGGVTTGWRPGARWRLGDLGALGDVELDGLGLLRASHLLGWR